MILKLYFYYCMHGNYIAEGPAMMPRCSEALSLTNRSLTTARVQIPASAYKKLACDFGLGVGFSQLVRFSPLFATG